MNDAAAIARAANVEMSAAADAALGRAAPTGGLFGLGASKPPVPPKGESQKRCRAAIAKAKTAWNAFAATNNIGRPLDVGEALKAV